MGLIVTGPCHRLSSFNIVLWSFYLFMFSAQLRLCANIRRKLCCGGILKALFEAIVFLRP